MGIKITQGFDVNQDGTNDVYVTRKVGPIDPIGCLAVIVIVAITLTVILVYRHYSDAKLGGPKPGVMQEP